ncbi:hypothetical protein F5X96DRAFT_644678 [Biscogniauxia mediterranea]|nr:hypothetical protein F5X96DRAFT_644678 [Biscogniauxia mediterranea]
MLMSLFSFFSLSLCLFSYLLSNITQYATQLPPTWIGRLCVSGSKQKVFFLLLLTTHFLVVGFSVALCLSISLTFDSQCPTHQCHAKEEKKKEKQKKTGVVVKQREDPCPRGVMVKKRNASLRLTELANPPRGEEGGETPK